MEQLETQEKDCVGVRVTFKENEDGREEVFYSLAAHRLAIMQMIHREKSLEDIFLELTEDIQPATREKRHLFRSGKKENMLEAEVK